MSSPLTTLAGGHSSPTSPRYAELHCHSDFSFLDGASSAEDLVERAVELGLGALALTDHQGLYGAVRFVTAAQEAGLRPIVGMEVELLDAAVPDPGGLVVPAPARTARARNGGTLPRTPPVGRGAGGRPPCRASTAPAAAGPPRAAARGPARRPRRASGVRTCVLLARDMTGYRSLCRLASAAHLAGTKGVPRFTHALLAGHTEGLMALTGCRHGELARRLLAGDRTGAAEVARRSHGCSARGRPRCESSFYLELQHHLLPDDDWLVAETVRLAEELGLPLVVTNDAHYARPADRELQDVLVGIRHGRRSTRAPTCAGPTGSTTSSAEAELRRCRRPDVADAGRRWWRRPGDGESVGLRELDAGELGGRCRVELGFERYRFPGFPRARRRDAVQRSRATVPRGLRGGATTRSRRAVVKQLAHELEVIERTGLAEFFLICWDLMRFCRERGIPAQGRGSAGDSIVAYVLGITRVDPIRHKLLFERFINEGRTGLPGRGHRLRLVPARGGHPVRLRALRRRAHRHGLQRGHLPRPLGGARGGLRAGLPAAAGGSRGQGARDLRLGDGPARPGGGGGFAEFFREPEVPGGRAGTPSHPGVVASPGVAARQASRRVRPGPRRAASWTAWASSIIATPTDPSRTSWPHRRSGWPRGSRPARARPTTRAAPVTPRPAWLGCGRAGNSRRSVGWRGLPRLGRARARSTDGGSIRRPGVLLPAERRIDGARRPEDGEWHGTRRSRGGRSGAGSVGTSGTLGYRRRSRPRAWPASRPSHARCLAADPPPASRRGSAGWSCAPASTASRATSRSNRAGCSSRARRWWTSRRWSAPPCPAASWSSTTSATSRRSS